MTQKLLIEKASGCVYFATPELENNPGFEPYEPKPAKKSEPVAVQVEEQVVVESTEPDIKEMAAAVLKKRK